MYNVNDIVSILSGKYRGKLLQITIDSIIKRGEDFLYIDNSTGEIYVEANLVKIETYPHLKIIGKPFIISTTVCICEVVSQTTRNEYMLVVESAKRWILLDKKELSVLRHT
jgi:hypothetical protein